MDSKRILLVAVLVAFVSTMVGHEVAEARDHAQPRLLLVEGDGSAPAPGDVGLQGGASTACSFAPGHGTVLGFPEPTGLKEAPCISLLEVNWTVFLHGDDIYFPIDHPPRP